MTMSQIRYCLKWGPSGAGPQCMLGSVGTTYGLWRPYMAEVTCNRRITAPDHFQDTRHIEFALHDPSLTYEPGDLLCIFPQQSPAAIAAFLQHTGLAADSWVSVEAADPTPGSKPVVIKVKCTALLPCLCCCHAQPHCRLWMFAAPYKSTGRSAQPNFAGLEASVILTEQTKQVH